MINNFLSNAIKYSPAGTNIHITSGNADNMAWVGIKDEGIGIKLKDQEKLFERYHRIENSHTYTISGFGIGLYLSSEIIQRHNGKVWVESEPDQGSTFFFSLPLS